jgi:hypothetical protein
LGADVEIVAVKAPPIIRDKCGHALGILLMGGIKKLVATIAVLRTVFIVVKIIPNDARQIPRK